MSNLIIIFGVVVLAKFVINLSRYLACNKYHNIYFAYLEKPEWKFEENQSQIIKLFKDAGVEDNFRPHVEPMGYNYVSTAHVSVMGNIGVRRQDVVQSVTAMFYRAKGIYRSRMLDAINPLYWLMFIIYLPKNLFQYVGASPESMGVKILQVVYWFGGILVSVFNNEITAYIRKILTDILGNK